MSNVSKALGGMGGSLAAYGVIAFLPADTPWWGHLVALGIITFAAVWISPANTPKKSP